APPKRSPPRRSCRRGSSVRTQRPVPSKSERPPTSRSSRAIRPGGLAICDKRESSCSTASCSTPKPCAARPGSAADLHDSGRINKTQPSTALGVYQQRAMRKVFACLVVAGLGASFAAAPAAPTALTSLTRGDVRWLDRVTYGINAPTVARYRRLGREKFL